MREEEGGGERSEQRETRALTPPQFKDMKKRDCVVTLKIAIAILQYMFITAVLIYITRKSYQSVLVPIFLHLQGRGPTACFSQNSLVVISPLSTAFGDARRKNGAEQRPPTPLLTGTQWIGA